MSDLLNQPDAANCSAAPCQAVSLVISPKQKDIGGFFVRRLLPVAKCRHVGPWVFFDHMGPAQFEAGKGIDVRPHPHINLATVTYLFEGEILHRDSVGSLQAIRPGDINLMVAGKGIVHSERETEATRNSDHVLHGLQLWLALPEEFEEIDPAFYHYPSAQIPAVDLQGVKLRVIKGSAFGVTSPVKTFADTLYVEAAMAANASLEVPPAQERAVYVAQGSINIDGVTINQYDMAILGGRPGLTITASEEARIAIIGGEPVGDRFMYWNFVSSRKERIQQAKQQWQDGEFPKVTGDEDEFIPLP